MALNFPANPNDGDTYDNFYWDDTAGIWRRQLSVTDLADLDSKPINDLDDVDSGSPSDEDILIYNSGTGNWESGSVNNIVASPELSALTDTTITSAADGEVLKYNGSSWLNEEVATNTDGDPGGRIYVGSVDPDDNFTLKTGDVWIEVP